MIAWTFVLGGLVRFTWKYIEWLQDLPTGVQSCTVYFVISEHVRMGLKIDLSGWWFHI